MPVATCILEDDEAPLRQVPSAEPVLELGAGLATTSGRSVVRWNPEGAQPEPLCDERWDPLTDGIETVAFQWGM